ncbi:MAG: YceI family protein [Nitrospirota bacterium]
MGKWIIDPDHSVAAFSVRHMMVANVRGQFNQITGFVQMDKDNKKIDFIEAHIKAEGIFTGIKKRDEHLRSPDFFDVDKYPEITFTSAEIEGDTKGSFRVRGHLTIHGITRFVSCSDVKFAGPVKSPFGGELTIGLSAVLEINREDFGITWNEPLEGGGVLVSKEVRLFIDAEADLVE